MLLAVKHEMIVAITAMHSQKIIVKSFALKLFSTIFPYSSTVGHPHPNQFITYCELNKE